MEFEYAEGAPGTTAESTQPGDWQDVRLPSELVANLRRAAQVYNVTLMEGHLQQMEGLGERAAGLAGHLRELRQRYDMAGIVELLERVDHD